MTAPSGFSGEAGARSAINAVRHFVGLLSTDGTLLEVNAAALTAGGLERDDVVGRPFWEARWWSHDPAVRARLIEAVRRAAAGETVRYPVQVLGADAGRSLITIDFTLSPATAADGTVEFLVPEGHPIDDASGDDAFALAELVAEAAAARDEARSLRELAATLAEAHTLDRVARVVVERLPDVIDVEFCNVTLRYEPDMALIHQPDRLDTTITARWTRVPLAASSPATDAIRDGSVILVPDRAAAAERYPELVDDLTAAGLESVAAVPIADPQGEAAAAIGLGTTEPGGIDLDRSRAAIDLCGAALQRAIATQGEARLGSLLDTLIRTAPIGFAFIDPELRFAMVNDRLAEINGLAADDHVGRRIDDIVPDLAAQVTPHIRAVLDDGAARTDITVEGVTGASRDRRTWASSYYPVEDEGGGTIHGVGIVVEETTERVRHQRELAAVANRVTSALAASDSGVFEWHPPTGRVTWTQEYARLYGFDERDEPSFDTWFGRVHADDRAAVQADVDRFLAHDVEWRHEFRIVHPTRGVLWLQSVADVERNASGAVVRVTGLNIDVTDRKERELEIAHLHQEQRRVAQRLQAGLMPGGLPDVPGYEVCGRYRAGTDGLTVGGDWYDVIVVGDRDVALVVGDVVGHDLDAAIGMAQLRHALAGLSHARADPSAVLADLDQFAASAPAVLASTLWYARLDPTTGALTYTTAGHPAPMIRHGDGRVETLAGGLGPPVGVARSWREQATATLPGSSRLLAFTDGLIERRDEPIDESRARLARCLERSTGSLVDAVDDLLDRVPDPRNGDDVAVLALACDA